MAIITSSTSSKLSPLHPAFSTHLHQGCSAPLFSGQHFSVIPNTFQQTFFNHSPSIHQSQVQPAQQLCSSPPNFSPHPMAIWLSCQVQQCPQPPFLISFAPVNQCVRFISMLQVLHLSLGIAIGFIPHQSQTCPSIILAQHITHQLHQQFLPTSNPS